MTPVETVLARFRLPNDPSTGKEIELYDYQVKVVNELAPKPKQGHYLAVGVGKTLTSTMCVLYKLIMGEIDRVIVNMPPILLLQWYRFINGITDKQTGKPLSVNIYRGLPKERKEMSLRYRFNLMTYNIFKIDYDRLCTEFDQSRTAVIDDEASAIKNIESANYKHTRNFTLDGHLLLLTGTPASKPEDCYAYIKLIAPEVYRNRNHFMNMHVADYDFFGNPSKYKNLELLAENMKVNAVRILKEDVLTQLPPVTYSTIDYELDPAHMKLYRRLLDEQLLELPDGGKIDATMTQRLQHAMQQIVLNYAHFSGNPKDYSRGFDVIEEVNEEVGNRKLLVFTNYRLTSESVHNFLISKGHDTVALHGGISRRQQDKNVERFLTDNNCTRMVVQPQAGGLGWNPQGVCSCELFMEAPTSPILWEQSTGRVDRNGQRHPVQIWIAKAIGTVQVRMFNNLMKNDALVNQVVRNRADLRDLLLGK